MFLLGMVAGMTGVWGLHLAKAAKKPETAFMFHVIEGGKTIWFECVVIRYLSSSGLTSP
jgi:hypothetical protein